MMHHVVPRYRYIYLCASTCVVCAHTLLFFAQTHFSCYSSQYLVHVNAFVYKALLKFYLTHAVVSRKTNL